MGLLIRQKIPRILFRVSLVSLILALVWTGIILFTARSPRIGLDDWCSDHYSHYMSTLLFLKAGLDIYRRPIGDFCDSARPLTDKSLQSMLAREETRAEICFLKDDSFQRPLFINWQRFPRPYPPGHLIYFLPEALLYQHTSLHFSTINQIVIAKFILMAHACWIILFLLLYDFRPRAIAWTLLIVGYLELVKFALIGFYDGIAIMALLLSLLSLKHRKGVLSFLFYSAACFLHFRALWFFPFLFWAGYLMLSQREFQPPPAVAAEKAVSRQNWLLAILAGVMLLLTAVSFLLQYSYLTQYSLSNPVMLNGFDLLTKMGLNFWWVTAGVFLYFFYRRFWLGLMVLVAFALFWVQTPQLRFWHSLFLLPVLVLPSIVQKQWLRVELTFVSFLWYVITGLVVFQSNFFPGWITSLFRRFIGG